MGHVEPGVSLDRGPRPGVSSGGICQPDGWSVGCRDSEAAGVAQKIEKYISTLGAAIEWGARPAQVQVRPDREIEKKKG